jgi:prepilin-type N-terminal cleavage/methylation domain-containing protein
MCGKARDIKVQKSHNESCGKGGFTLVELCVVLALLAILTTMIVSFSVLMNGFVAENKAEYEFLEDHAMLKERLCTWVAENDVSGSVFAINESGMLTVTENGTERSVSFAGGVLSLDDEKIKGFDAIDGMSFTSNEKLIKCVTYRTEKGGQRVENSFVFSLRCGVIEEVAE